MKQFKSEGAGAEEFIIEYFRQVRGELTTRVQININLILQKVVTCGAALGFLFSQKAIKSEELLVSCEIQLLGFAIIPLIAMGYDVLIARNINNLHRLGTFIRNELESLVPDLKSKLWERKYGQPDQGGPANHGVAESNFLSLFTLATEVTAIVIYWNTYPWYLLIIFFLLLLHIWVYFFMRKQMLEFEPFED